MINQDLKIELKKDKDTIFCKLAGWLDPNTSPELLRQVDLTDVKSLVIDLAEVEYIFSYGLRVLLIFQKMLEDNGGTIKLINVPEQVRSVFEDTGLDKMLEIKA